MPDTATTLDLPRRQAALDALTRRMRALGAEFDASSDEERGALWSAPGSPRGYR